MKKVHAAFLIFFFLTACVNQNLRVEINQPRITDTATSTVVLSATPRLPIPTATVALTSTSTPDPIMSHFSAAELILEENFDLVTSEFDREIWRTNSQKVVISSAGELQIAGNTSITFHGPPLELNQAVILKVKFLPESQFHLGFQGIVNGGLIGPGHMDYSAYLVDVAPSQSSASVWREDDFGYTQVDMLLQADTWYTVVLGVSDEKSFFVKVWEEENSWIILQELAWFDFTSEEIADSFRFVIWVNDDSQILLDEFKVIQVSRFLP